MQEPMQEPVKQPKSKKTFHIGYIIAIIIPILAVIFAVIFWPEPTPPTPTPTPTPTATPTPTPTPTPSPIVSITTPATVDKSSSFHVFVNISTVSNLGGAQFDLKYDPKVITVINISNGKINGIAVPMQSWAYIPAGTQGTVRVILLDPNLSGINGEGYLADITFSAKGKSGSSSNISFIQTLADLESRLYIGDITADDIPTSWINGSITIK